MSKYSWVEVLIVSTLQWTIEWLMHYFMGGLVSVGSSRSLKSGGARTKKGWLFHKRPLHYSSFQRAKTVQGANASNRSSKRTGRSIRRYRSYHCHWTHVELLLLLRRSQWVIVHCAEYYPSLWEVVDFDWLLNTDISSRSWAYFMSPRDSMTEIQCDNGNKSLY